MDVSKILEKQLGGDFVAKNSTYLSVLPAYLSKPYQHKIIKAFGVEFCLLAVMKTDFNVTTYQKHLDAMKVIASMPVALYFPSLTSYQRKSLIQRKIPFVAGESQVYLPFLGVTLSDQTDVINISRQSFSAMAQYLFLYMFYQKETDSFVQADLAKTLDVQSMNISRGIREICELGLMKAAPESVNKRISFPMSRQDVLEKALPYMESPIQKTVEVPVERVPSNAVIAGDEALAKRTMMAETFETVRAIYRMKYKALNTSKMGSPEDYSMVSLQLWKYQPETLTPDGIADPISLYLCYRDVKDERIQKELKGMMKGLGYKI